VTQKAAAELKFSLDTRIYPLEAIQAAAYAFTDRAFVRIAPEADASVAVRFKAKKSAKDVEALSDAFHNELLHESLRLRISAANQKLREYVVTKALVSAQEDSNTLPGVQADAPAPPEAEPSAPLVDAALEREIEALLAEIEKAEPGAGDPLGVSVPWQVKHEGKSAGGAPPAKKEP